MTKLMATQVDVSKIIWFVSSIAYNAKFPQDSEKVLACVRPVWRSLQNPQIPSPDGYCNNKEQLFKWINILGQLTPAVTGPIIPQIQPTQHQQRIRAYKQMRANAQRAAAQRRQMLNM